MDETFFILSFMALSFEIQKTFNQNKFCSKLFLPTKLTFKKNNLVFHFLGKNNLEQNLFWLNVLCISSDMAMIERIKKFSSIFYY